MDLCSYILWKNGLQLGTGQRIYVYYTFTEDSNKWVELELVPHRVSSNVMGISWIATEVDNLSEPWGSTTTRTNLGSGTINKNLTFDDLAFDMHAMFNYVKSNITLTNHTLDQIVKY